MKKSSLILILAVALVLGTTAIGFSEPGHPCNYTCKGWSDGGDIPFGHEAGEQSTATCYAFDYENSYNYCGPGSGSRWFVMKACDCPSYLQNPWDTNIKFGVRMEIVDKNGDPLDGVYFTDSNNSLESFQCPSLTNACSPGNTISPTSIGVALLDSSQNWFSNPDGKNNCPDFCTNSATPLAMAYEPVESGKILYPETYPLDCTFKTILPFTSAIKTTCEYAFFKGTSGQPWLLFDVPNMIADPSKVELGEEVYVKISLTTTSDVICPNCTEICSCIKKIGVLECHLAAQKTPTTHKLCFPYFPQISGNWWAGIVLTNSGNKDAKVVMTFWGGNENGFNSVSKTYTIPAHNTWVKSLDELGLDQLATYSGIYMSLIGTVDDGMGGIAPASLDGICIIGDTNTGQAYGYDAKDGPCGIDRSQP